MQRDPSLPERRAPDFGAAASPIDDSGFAREFFEKFAHPQTMQICGRINLICYLVDNSSYDDASRCFDILNKEISPPLNPVAIAWLLNTPFKLADGSEAQSVLARLVSKDPSKAILHKFLVAGASPDYKYRYQDHYLKKDGQEVRDIYFDNSIAHLAAAQLNLVALRELVKIGFNMNLKNHAGLTPFGLYLTMYGGPDEGAKLSSKVFRFLLATADADLSTPYHPVAISLKTHNLEGFRAIVERKICPPIEHKTRKFLIETSKGEVEVDYNFLLREILAICDKIEKNDNPIPSKITPKDIIAESLRLHNKSGNIYHLYLYLQSYLDTTDKVPEPSGKPFARLAIAITTNYALNDIRYLLHHIDAHQDLLYYESDPKIPRDYHANEAEFLLLLAHRDLIDRFDPTLASSVTRAITSPYRYWDYGLKNISMEDGGWMTVQNWQRIGQLTHSHLNWRFDAISPKDFTTGVVLAPSMLEDFGFERVPRTFVHQQLYGATLALRPASLNLNYLPNQKDTATVSNFSEDALVVFAQAYLLCSDPRLGTIVIRNSSLVFGRNSMRHPAYYCPFGLNEGIELDQLLHLDQTFLGRSCNGIIDKEINGIVMPLMGLDGTDSREDIMHLLAQLTSVFDHYNRWKFDTNPETAFRKSKGITHNDILGAYNSSGFTSMVRNLKHFCDASIQADNPALMPNLAFVHAYNPPWQYYPFTAQRIGVETPITAKRYEVDPFSMEVLTGLAQGEYNYPDFHLSGLKAFFQAGMQAQANLIMVA